MAALDRAELEDALATLGELLAFRGERFDVALIGGSGLILLGLVRRATTDVDVVGLVEDGVVATSKPLPDQLAAAVRDVGRARGLGESWFNPGPASLLDFGLPAGFLARCVVATFGALRVHLASRFDQVHFKLYAAADQGPRSKHFLDLMQLAPTKDELASASDWCREHDPSDGFRLQLAAAVKAASDRG